MALKKYTCPPQTPTGSGTFADNLVGFQLVQGGGLTQGNFEFVTGVNEKANRQFLIGAFSDPITLETLKIEDINQSRLLVQKNFQVFPNFDLSDVTRFTLYGSLAKRLSVSIQNIINHFPAAIEVNRVRPNFSTGNTAFNIVYNSVTDQTYLEMNVTTFKNPFEIDYSRNAAINLSAREIETSKYRNFTNNYVSYSIFVNGVQYNVMSITPTQTLTSGILKLYVTGNPFQGASTTTDTIILRLQDFYTEEVFTQEFDEVEKFLLNRLISPPYTATFKVPQESDGGQYYISTKSISWPLDGSWNLDIRTPSFTNYLSELSQIADSIDEYKTNLISRFLTTDSLKEFDSLDQKAEKIFQIYGRSFDELKHFIDALAFMNSVNYTIKNDIPSQLLKNLAQTLGWKTNISPITRAEFLDSVFGNTTEVIFSGFSRAQTPDELNYQYFRNLILNSAFLFKSKGTRKSIEGLMRLIGAPEALIEFNENIYMVDQTINMRQFNNQFLNISGGTYSTNLPVLDPNDVYSIFGVSYTGFTTTPIIEDVNTTRLDYPVDYDGYPVMAQVSESYFFQKGAGWYESTPQHRSPEYVNLSNSVFTGQSPSVQTKLEPFTYGQKYLQRYRRFPFMTNGYNIVRIVDNKKSWTDGDVGLRVNTDGNFNARYVSQTDKFVINVKNIDLFLNPAQGLAYDVWYMSNRYDYPIPDSGFTAPYPYPPGVDWTIINPEPKRQTFFEFAQSFWKNMINVRDRQFNTDGKTSGYPLLQKIYWLYLQSGTAIGVPNDNFTYRTMVDYVTGLGDYWIRLVDQMIPATTIWNGGLRYENSIFHRQKFVWRRQAGCQIVPVPCEPCKITAEFFDNDCQTEFVTCPLWPNDTFTNFGLLLNIAIDESGIDLGACNANTLSSTWFIVFTLDGNTIIEQPFFNGFGVNDPNYSFPTPQNWLDSINDALFDLFNDGFGYIIYQYGSTPNDRDYMGIYNLDCYPDNIGKDFSFDIRINFTINCI